MAKRVIAVVLILGILSVVGCSPDQPQTSDSQDAGSGILLDAFMSCLMELLEDAGYNDITKHADLDEVTSYSIGDPVTDERYHLSVNYNADDEITSVIMSIQPLGNPTKLDFAVLSAYIYRSLNLPDMEADAFYDKFQLLEDNIASESGTRSVYDTISGWDIMVMDMGGEGDVLRNIGFSWVAAQPEG